MTGINKESNNETGGGGGCIKDNLYGLQKDNSPEGIF